jgi:3-oxoacyl-ACP reductase-like protein
MDLCMLDGLKVKLTEVKGRYEKDILLHAGVRLIGKYYKTFYNFNLTLPFRT